MTTPAFTCFKTSSGMRAMIPTSHVVISSTGEGLTITEVGGSSIGYDPVSSVIEVSFLDHREAWDYVTNNKEN
ncbi:MAG: hypothetical protein F6K48_03365 [Okeania sp. SIO3H1]|nr:hypothetical protein [Okeania sp. SIO3H1]